MAARSFAMKLVEPRTSLRVRLRRWLLKPTPEEAQWLAIDEDRFERWKLEMAKDPAWHLFKDRWMASFLSSADRSSGPDRLQRLEVVASRLQRELLAVRADVQILEGRAANPPPAPVGPRKTARNRSASS